MIRPQLERGEIAGELLFPILEVLLELRGLEQAPLPGGELTAAQAEAAAAPPAE